MVDFTVPAKADSDALTDQALADAAFMRPFLADGGWQETFVLAAAGNVAALLREQFPGVRDIGRVVMSAQQALSGIHAGMAGAGMPGDPGVLLLIAGLAGEQLDRDERHPDYTTEDPKVPPLSLPPESGGLDGAEASSLAPAPGVSPRSAARGAVPDVPASGTAASPPRRPPVRGGLASLTPGDGGKEGPPSPGLDPASGGSASPSLAAHAPAGGDAADPAPLAGQDWRDAVNAEKSRQARDARNQRGKPRAARGQARRQAGMIRRMPPGGAA